MATLIERLAELHTLPAPPRIVGRLLSLLAADEVDTDEIAKLISSDRALSLMVIRIANSVGLGSTVKVSSVAEALVRIGSMKLTKLVISQVSEQVMRDAGKGYGLEGQEAWEGALAGALIAERIAKRVGAEPASAFTASLLRDCGKLAMDALCGIEELRQVLEHKDTGQCQLDVERIAFGSDHAEVGAALARSWGLSEEIEQAIRWHHEPGRAASSRLVDTVHASDLVAAQLGYGVGLDGLAYRVDEAAVERLGLRDTDLVEILIQASLSVREFMTELQSLGQGG